MQSPEKPKPSEPEKQEQPGVAGPTAPAPADVETSDDPSDEEVKDNKKGGYGAG